MGMNQYFCDAAFLGGETAVENVLIKVEAEHITAVDTGVDHLPDGTVHLRGLTLPGFANAHSHVFHRALRARTEQSGTFWSWRDRMYAAASVLDPDRFERLARATFAEMVLCGYTAVGEFHYIHHPPNGGHYSNPNEMGLALFEAAAAAGIRITLLDACYLRGGPEQSLDGVQLRFGDGSAEAWAERMDVLQVPEGARLGAAIHSVRAVSPGDCAVVAEWAIDHQSPLHFHLSEQIAENDAVVAAYGTSPTGVLESAGALRPSSTAVHATHLDRNDIAMLGGSGTGACFCPTTERDLADGIGPGAVLAGAGSPLSLGSDSQAVIDPFEEMRALEMDERLSTARRGHFSATSLLEAGTAVGHRAIGWEEAGCITPGALADLVTVSLESPRLAGVGSECMLEYAVFAAGPSDITDVVISGRPVVSEGQHLMVPDVADALRRAIGEVTEALGSK